MTVKWNPFIKIPNACMIWNSILKMFHFLSEYKIGLQVIVPNWYHQYKNYIFVEDEDGFTQLHLNWYLSEQCGS